MKFNQLKRYVEIDTEKIEIIESLKPKTAFYSKGVDECANYSRMEYAEDYNRVCADMEYSDEAVLREPSLKLPKICPKCQKMYPESENFCSDCLVTLKDITDEVDIKAINIDPKIEFAGKAESSNILTDDNFQLISDFDFTIDDFDDILHSIKAQSFKNMDRIIKDNSIDLDDLDALDKVLLFSKSFVNVEYKSYGGDLGYFEFDKIYVDDRQRKSLQITTLIHELTHFLMKEILTHVTCRILDVTKNEHVESVITYILSYSVFNRLIDEYAAHSVEGRFTIFGYQDYSSFIALQNELDGEHIDIAKTIANTFAIHIKDMLEGFLDWDVRDEIKEQFLEDTIEDPDYSQLRFESCTKLSDDGFLKAIWLILTEGFRDADIDTVNSYMREFGN